MDQAIADLEKDFNDEEKGSDPGPSSGPVDN
jgi:hypothetical protein